MQQQMACTAPGEGLHSRPAAWALAESVAEDFMQGHFKITMLCPQKITAASRNEFVFCLVFWNEACVSERWSPANENGAQWDLSCCTVTQRQSSCDGQLIHLKGLRHQCRFLPYSSSPKQLPFNLKLCGRGKSQHHCNRGFHRAI